MKRVEGYITNDGQFFDKELDARYYEYRKALDAVLENNGLDAQTIREFIIENNVIVTQFITVYADVERQVANEEREIHDAPNTNSVKSASLFAQHPKRS